MSARIFVISDLHLGGTEDFQMCPAKGRERLANFIDWAGGQKSGAEDLRLVVNGDFVDFLAERDDAGGFSAFNVKEDNAERKLKRIAESCKDVFSSLNRFLAGGAALTLMVGNHDVELSLPRVRARLLELLGAGRVEFLYDNEAYTIGEVLIEHGNRYDGWNMVNHGQLRELRSRLSRREPAIEFSAQPGSELVARVMNPLKDKFAFVDLLKPETGVVVPILAVLDPAAWNKVARALEEKVRAWHRGRFNSQGTPTQSDFVVADKASAANPMQLPSELQDPFDQARKLIDEHKSASDDKIGWFEDIPVRALVKAFRYRQGSLDRPFDTEFEDKEYLGPARSLAAQGKFKVVVFGHTHLVKRVPLDDGSVYLNTGTWADLMRLPKAVFTASEDEACAVLQEFLQDVKHNRIERYRRQVPTFARIEVDSRGSVSDAGVYFFDETGKAFPVTTAGLAERLG